MDGSAGPRAQSTQSFMRNLEGVIDCPIVGWDERLSTMAGDTHAARSGCLARAARPTRRTSSRPSYILQGAIDRLGMLEDARTEAEDAQARPRGTTRIESKAVRGLPGQAAWGAEFSRQYRIDRIGVIGSAQALQHAGLAQHARDPVRAP